MKKICLLLRHSMQSARGRWKTGVYHQLEVRPWRHVLRVRPSGGSSFKAMVPLPPGRDSGGRKNKHTQFEGGEGTRPRKNSQH